MVDFVLPKDNITWWIDFSLLFDMHVYNSHLKPTCLPPQSHSKCNCRIHVGSSHSDSNVCPHHYPHTITNIDTQLSAQRSSLSVLTQNCLGNCTITKCLCSKTERKCVMERGGMRWKGSVGKRGHENREEGG